MSDEIEDFDDFDDLDDMDDIDIDFSDIDGGSSDRNPVIRFGRSFLEDSLNTLQERSFQESVVRKALPDGYGDAYKEINETWDYGEEVINELKRESRPLVKSGRKLSRLISKAMKPVAPDFITKALDDFSKDEDETSNLEKTDHKQLEIDKTINDIFNTTSEGVINEKVRKERKQDAKDSVMADILTRIRSNTSRLVSYQDTIGINYQKKSLELQYRHYFAARDQLELLTRHVKENKEQLDAVIKNTALPEYLKLTNTEGVKEKIRDQIIEGSLNTASEYFRGFKDKFKKNLKEKLVNSVRGISSIVDPFIDSLESMESLEGGSPLLNMLRNMLSEKLTSSVADRITNYISKVLEGNDSVEIKALRIKSFLMSQPTSIKAIILRSIESLNLRIDELHEESNAENLGLFSKAKLMARRTLLKGIGFGFEYVADALPTHDPEVVLKNNKMIAHETPGFYSELTDRTITEIIPGLLTEILHESTLIRTGNRNPTKDVDRVIFDWDKEKFDLKSKVIKRTQDSILKERTRLGIDGELKKILDIVKNNGALLEAVGLEEKDLVHLSNQIVRNAMKGETINSYVLSKESSYDKIPKEIGKKFALMFKVLGNEFNELERKEEDLKPLSDMSEANERSFATQMSKLVEYSSNILDEMPNFKKQMYNLRKLYGAKMLEESKLLRNVNEATINGVPITAVKRKEINEALSRLNSSEKRRDYLRENNIENFNAVSNERLLDLKSITDYMAIDEGDKGDYSSFLDRKETASERAYPEIFTSNLPMSETPNTQNLTLDRIADLNTEQLAKLTEIDIKLANMALNISNTPSPTSNLSTDYLDLAVETLGGKLEYIQNTFEHAINLYTNMQDENKERTSAFRDVLLTGIEDISKKMINMDELKETFSRLTNQDELKGVIKDIDTSIKLAHKELIYRDFVGDLSIADINYRIYSILKDWDKKGGPSGGGGGGGGGKPLDEAKYRRIFEEDRARRERIDREEAERKNKDNTAQASLPRGYEYLRENNKTYIVKRQKIVGGEDRITIVSELGSNDTTQSYTSGNVEHIDFSGNSSGVGSSFGGGGRENNIRDMITPIDISNIGQNREVTNPLSNPLSNIASNDNTSDGGGGGTDLDLIAELIKENTRSIKESLESGNLVDRLGGLSKEFNEGFKSFSSYLSNFDFKGLKETIKENTVSSLKGLKDMFDNSALANLNPLLKDLVNKSSEGILSLKESTEKTYGELVKNFNQMMEEGGSLHTAKTYAQDKYKEIVETLTGVLETANKEKENFKGTLKEMVEVYRQQGETFLDKVIEFFSKGFKGVIEGVSKVAKGVKDFFFEGGAKKKIEEYYNLVSKQADDKKNLLLDKALSKMVSMGYISEEEVASLKNEDKFNKIKEITTDKMRDVDAKDFLNELEIGFKELIGKFKGMLSEGWETFKEGSERIFKGPDKLQTAKENILWFDPLTEFLDKKFLILKDAIDGISLKGDFGSYIKSKMISAMGMGNEYLVSLYKYARNIYKEGLKEPLMLSADLKAGRYILEETGKPIWNIKQITGPVRDQLSGEIVVTSEDIPLLYVNGIRGRVYSKFLQEGNILKRALKYGTDLLLAPVKKTIEKMKPAFINYRNKIVDIYHRDMPKSEGPLLLARDLRLGRYIDTVTNEPVRTFYDIKNPVYDTVDKVIVISTSDIRENRIYTLEGHSLLGTYRHLVGKTLDIMTMPFRVGTDLLKEGVKALVYKKGVDLKVGDIYVGNEKEPRLLKIKMDRGLYRTPSGKVIRSIKDIERYKEIVHLYHYDGSFDLVISEEDFDEGFRYIDSPLIRIGRSLVGAIGNTTAIMGDLIGSGWGLIRKATRALRDKVNKTKEIYLANDLKEPVLKALGLDRGFYLDSKTGKPIKKIDDIQEGVIDTEGNWIITPSEFIEIGVCYKDGLIKKLSKSVLNLGLTTVRLGVDSIKSSLQMGAKALKLLGKGIKFALSSPFKIMGSFMGGLLGGLFGTKESSEEVSNKIQLASLQIQGMQLSTQMEILKEMRSGKETNELEVVNSFNPAVIEERGLGKNFDLGSKLDSLILAISGLFNKKDNSDTDENGLRDNSFREMMGNNEETPRANRPLTNAPREEVRDLSEGEGLGDLFKSLLPSLGGFSLLDLLGTGGDFIKDAFSKVKGGIARFFASNAIRSGIVAGASFLSLPVVLGGSAIALASYGAYKLYKNFSNPFKIKIDEIKLALYGVGKEDEHAEEMANLILNYEEAVLNKLVKIVGGKADVDTKGLDTATDKFLKETKGMENIDKDKLSETLAVKVLPVYIYFTKIFEEHNISRSSDFDSKISAKKRYEIYDRLKDSDFLKEVTSVKNYILNNANLSASEVRSLIQVELDILSKDKNSERIKDIIDQGPVKDVADNLEKDTPRVINRPLPLDNFETKKEQETRVNYNLEQANVPDREETIERTSYKSSGKKGEEITDREEYVKHIYDLLKKYTEGTNLDPRAILAQTILETGWGKHSPKHPNGEPSFNIFGIKADSRWKGDVVNASTKEDYGSGMVTIRDGFRSYNSYEEAVKDYINFIYSNPRYSNAISVGKDPKEYYKALKQAGYATDPKYPLKLMSIYEGKTLRDILGDTNKEEPLKIAQEENKVVIEEPKPSKGEEVAREAIREEVVREKKREVKAERKVQKEDNIQSVLITNQLKQIEILNAIVSNIENTNSYLASIEETDKSQLEYLSDFLSKIGKNNKPQVSTDKVRPIQSEAPTESIVDLRRSM